MCEPDGTLEQSVGPETAARLTEIYESTYDRIYRYCYYRLFRTAAAEDVASAVFLRLTERIDQLDRDDVGIRLWLYGTARNEISAYLRSVKKTSEILAEVWRRRAAVVSGDDEEEHEENWPGVYEAMLHLKPIDRDIITLRFFEGLSTKEASDILGMGHVGLRVRTYRALRKLRRHLSGPDGP
jgi:RNA polymerase sigma-70 factor (ECF subfamily)